MIRFFWPILLIQLPCFSQDRIHVPRNAVLAHLANFSGAINQITTWRYKPIPAERLPARLQTESQYLVKTRTGLFSGIDGAGILYRLTDSAGGMIFTRIDSTFYSGNTFGAMHFSINDVIYSYAGYGFWKSNGMLRAFSGVTNEWISIRTDREVPCIYPIAWVDAAGSYLYVFGSKETNDALKVTNYHYDSVLYRLSLSDNRWIPYGIFPSPASLDFFTPWGPVAGSSSGEWILYDLQSNRRLRADSALSVLLLKTLTSNRKNFIYTGDSTLFFGNFEQEKLDSIHLSRGHFVDTGLPVFTNPATSDSASSPRVIYLLSILGAAGAVVFWVIRKRSRRTESDRAVPTGAIQTRSGGAQRESFKSVEFTIVEKGLLSYLLKHGPETGGIKIEEVNKLLGVSGKNESVQKKNRSEAISEINQKWRMVCSSDVNLIERIRSDSDKRIFFYLINPTELSALREIL